MSDYREKFYSEYHIAIGATQKELGQDHFLINARQYNGRWHKWLPTDRHAKILDIGCGCGEFLYYVRSQGYENTYGVDLNSTEISHAIQAGIPNVECVNALEYLDGVLEAFDIIVAFNLFEHLRKEEILHMLNLVRQALKPGGRLLAVTPNGLSPFAGATRYWDFSHETSFTPASWRQLARITGFEEVMFEEYGPIPHTLKGKIRLLFWDMIKISFDIVSYIEVGRPRDISRIYTADMKIILGK